MQRTLKLTLPKTRELLETIRQYNNIVNQHIKKSIEIDSTSKTRLHKELYSQIRTQKPEFPAALVQCARDNAVEILKSNKNNKKSYKRLDGSIRYDLRTSKAMLETGEIQLSTIKGRKKYNLTIPSYHDKYKDWKYKAVTLGVKDKNRLELRIVVEAEKPTPKIKSSSRVLGIDLGLKNLATLSNGEFIKAKDLKRVKRKHAHNRKRLQSIGTRSAKRKLKQIAGRERRLTTDYNHKLAKSIVSKDYQVIAIEDLNGIRRGNKKSKTFNRMLSNWSYHEFRKFLEYKAEDRGKMVIAVDPQNTSRSCSSCGFTRITNRYKGLFLCGRCGRNSNSDYNASENISRLGKHKVFYDGQGAVNSPKATLEDAKGSIVSNCGGQQSQAPSVRAV